MDIQKLASEFYAEAIAARRKIHQNPELAYQEFATTNLIKETLRRHEIEIEEIPLKTGVCAIIRGSFPGRTVTLREDIDALPLIENTGLPYASQNMGVSHSCGHDIHVSCLLLAGAILQEMKAELKGCVRLIFQPAEEVLTGARTVIEKGAGSLVPQSDFIVGVHTSPNYPGGSIALIKGPADASSDEIEITIKGKGGHGAHPDQTVDPILTSAYLLNQLQSIISRENSPLNPVVLSFGSIHGGTAPNIIPEEVTITGTLRAFDEYSRKKMTAAITRISENCCKAMRGEAIVKFGKSVPVLVNDGPLVNLIDQAAQKTIGRQNVYWQQAPSLGSDDFAFFLQHMRGAQFLIGTANENPDSKVGLHNPKVIFDESAIYTGAVVMSQVALDISSLQ